MQWDDVVADLLSQLEQAERAELQQTAAQLTQAELGRIALVDRLRGQQDSNLTCELVGGLRLTGIPSRVLAGWFLLQTAGGPALVFTDSVMTVSGLGRRSGPPLTTVESRLTAGHALRQFAGQRSPVVVCLRDSRRMEGTLGAVGADHLDLLPHPVDRWQGRTRTAPISIALPALAAVLQTSPS